MKRSGERAKSSGERGNKKSRPARRGRRLGTILALVGLLGLVGASFTAGMAAGLHPSYFATAGWSSFGKKSPDESRRGAEESRRTEKSRTATDKTRPAETIPNLTFYQELTAPLASPPPRPARAAASVERHSSAGESIAGSVDSGPFSVQLASYKSRSQAEALRETLAARGIGAYVSETTTASGSRYRVRVGPFDDKDSARQNAVRLAADTRLGAFVTSNAAAH